ncbi:hypothetical protein FACS1894201_03710 [Bacteroidia bacterium]|nr:hypothetical protein FACS1894201_03710 [Bacteroidia bacterium]
MDSSMGCSIFSITSISRSASGNLTAGSHNIVLNTLAISDGNSGNNYDTTFVGKSFTVNKLTLTHNVTVTPTKVYDGTTAAIHTGGLTNVIGNDLVTLNAALTYAAGKDVQTAGNITASTWSISGTDAGNYDLPTFVAQSADITTATLTVTAEDKSKAHGAANPALTIAYSGFVDGENESNLTTAPTATTTATTGSAVGAYPITAAGGVSNNYAFTYVAGTLTIDKIPLAITFAPADTLQLESGSYTLVATTANSVTVKFRISGSAAAANIDTSVNTQLNLLQSGNVTLTAYIDDSNYSATDVSHTIAIVSSNTNVSTVTVSDATPQAGITDFYLADCGAITTQITVTTAESGSQVIYKGTSGSSFDVDIARPDIHDVAYTVQSSDGSTQHYTLQIERRFAFADIVGMKFNNILYVNNNPADNGGYEFTHYAWYRNGQPIGIDRQYYTAGPARTDRLDPTADYSVTVTTIDGRALHVCPDRVPSTPTASLKSYPNPIQIGAKVTLESDAADGSVIRIYNISGELVGTHQLFGGTAQFPAPKAAGIYLITIDGEMATMLVE